MTLQSYILPEVRRAGLRQRIQTGQGLRLIEAHSGLSALVASRARLVDKGVEFDGLWVSSLTSSATRGLPDAALYMVDRRLDLVQEICANSCKPVVVDGDTGGESTQFKFLVSRLEALGVSAVVIEDKRQPKRNSLAEADHHLEDPAVFAAKIAQGKNVAKTSDFLVFARLESLIAGGTIDDAIKRACIYLDAGADGIMIHSKSKSPQPVLAFADEYGALLKGRNMRAPLICAPTTYNSVTAKQLFDRGIQIVIHANHLLRASHKAMEKVCESLLTHDKSQQSDHMCSPVARLLDQIGYSDVIADDVRNVPDVASQGRRLLPRRDECA